MRLRQVTRFILFVTALALCFGGAWQFSPHPVAGRTTGRGILHGEAALDRLKQDGHYESLQAALTQARFSVSRATHSPLGRAAWYAPNLSAGYDAYVTESGVSIALGGETCVGLSLHGIGYGGALQGVAPGQVSGDKQTINIERNGVREWFVNGPEGLEHGFTLDEPPGMRQAGTPLRLALQVSEGWRAVASEDGKRVTLRGAGDQAVEYGKLVARDNLGRNIQARLTADGKQVVIEVEDQDAVYPLTIDPLFTLQQRLLAADGAASEYFGHAVAVSGDTALIGAPYDENSRGSAYIFVRNGATWTQQARLLANDGVLNDYFGWSVALDGDTALIGAIYGPGNANADQGAAYVFTRSGTTWTQQARLGASDGQLGALFGTVVALDGTTAVVGAPDHQRLPDFLKTGAAYVFVRSGTAWTQQSQLLALNGDGGDQFGAAVAVDGDTALIGAPGKDLSIIGVLRTDIGAAYTFKRSEAVWTRGQQLDTRFNLGDTGDAFGSAVALSGDTALISAPLTSSADFGLVFVFERSALGFWNYATAFGSQSSAVGAHLGVSLALDGDTAVVGASLKLFESGTDSRSAWVFARINQDWRQIRQFGADVGSPDDRFGYAVAVSGNTVLTGAYRGDAAAPDQGAAYAFVLHDSQHVEQPKVIANDGAAQDHFGNAVALGGDTLVVSADEDDIGANVNQGSVYVFTRNGAGWNFQQKLTANDGAAQDRFGNALAFGGDTLVVGAALDDVGANGDQGSAYVFTRSGANWGFQQKLTAAANDSAAGDNFGAAVALNGATIAVGAPRVGGGQGAAFVFTRTGTTWAQQVKLTAPGGGQLPRFGAAVAVGGDYLFVGAPDDDSQQGAGYPYQRSGTNWLARPKFGPFNPAPGAQFGAALALEGFQVFVGAPRETVGANTHQGSVYLFSASSSGAIPVTQITAIDGAAEDNFGSAVALGNNIAILGAPGDDIGANSDQGSAYVYNRIGGQWSWQKKLIAGDGALSDGLGGAVAAGGDAVIAGAKNDAIGANAGQGAAYVFLSPVCPALTISPVSLPNGALGSAYNQPLTVSGGSVGDYLFRLSGGSLPPGMRLESLGILRGTPTAAGTYRLTIKSTFTANLCSGSREYVLTITPPCPALTVNPASATLADGQAGTPYSQTFTQTGGAGAAAFAITAGTLPNGLSLASGGLLSGTPTAFGDFTFTITATDANGCTGARTYLLHINSPCASITVNPASLPGGTTGAVYSQTATATGGTAPYTFTISAGALPNGLTLATSGALTGAPTVEGIFNFTIKATGANGCNGARAYTLTISRTATISGLQFYPLAAPLRLLDTRPGQLGCDAPGAPLTGGATRAQTASGRTCNGLSIPAGAKALTGNVTTVQSGGGYLTLYPSGAGQPLVANSNYAANEIVNNVFTVGLGEDGAFNLFAVTDTHVVVDVTGYYAPPAAIGGGGLYFHPLPAPVRLLDTRAGQQACFRPAAPLAGGANTPQTGWIACGGVTIPSTAKALVGNATTVNPHAGGYLTLYPADAAQPLAASSNFTTGQVMNAAFAVGLSATGEFKMFTTATTDLVIDVSGYYSADASDANGAGLLFNPLPKPIRLLETRAGQLGYDTPGAPLLGGSTRNEQARITYDGVTIAATARAIAGTATVVNAQGGYLTFWPSDAQQPLAATSNYQTGQVFNRHFTAGLGADGVFKIFAAGTTDLVIDAAGFFAP